MPDVVTTGEAPMCPRDLRCRLTTGHAGRCSWPEPVPDEPLEPALVECDRVNGCALTRGHSGECSRFEEAAAFDRFKRAVRRIRELDAERQAAAAELQRSHAALLEAVSPTPKAGG